MLFTRCWPFSYLSVFSFIIYVAVWNESHWGRGKMAATLAGDIIKYKFVNENDLIAIKISLTFVPEGPINDIPVLIQIMAWCWPGGKPLSKPMMA